MFGFSGISEIRLPKNRISGNPKIRIFSFSDFRISENLDLRKPENPDFPISRASDEEFSEASDAGHRRCPDPSKKHGDSLCLPYLPENVIILKEWISRWETFGCAIFGHFGVCLTSRASSTAVYVVAGGK